jgi:hypothetical protein
MQGKRDDEGLVELDSAFAIGRRRLVELLGSALVVERNEALRLSLGQMASGRRFSLALGTGGPYLIIDNGAIVDQVIAGPTPGEPTLSLPEAIADASSGRLFKRDLRAAVADAATSVQSLSDRADLLSGEDFQAVARWAPVLAVEAYRLSAVIQMTFDHVRRRLLDTPTPRDLRQYWEDVHLLSHLTLLAGTAEPSDWLAEMAQSFVWRRWTPSFPLIRERMMRLTVRGGWASARFGPSTIEPYFEMLREGPLLCAFDAVLGLVSIAVVSESGRAVVQRRLSRALERREREHDDESVVLAALRRSASCVLEHPEDADRRTIERGLALLTPELREGEGARQRALQRAMDDDDDGAEIDGAGLCPAIVAMGPLASAPASSFFPAAAMLRGKGATWSPERALNVILRTGAPREARASDHWLS